jgi:hypothetical protein
MNKCEWKIRNIIVHAGCFHNGSAQLGRRGLGPSRHFSLGPKQGTLSPTSPARLHRSILTGRWQLAGEGGAGDELWTTGNPWVVVGWKGAHHSGLAAVRKMMSLDGGDGSDQRSSAVKV